MTPSPHEVRHINISMSGGKTESDSGWQCLFCFLIGYSQQFHWLIIVFNNFFWFEVECFSTPKKKKNLVQGKEIIAFIVGASAQNCRKFSEVNSGAFMATKMCTPGCYTGKILSAVKNSWNVCKIKIKGMDVMWGLDAI